MNRLTTPFGSYELTRFPEDPRDRLRAWDAADEYLLRHLASGTGNAARWTWPAPGRSPSSVTAGER